MLYINGIKQSRRTYYAENVPVAHTLVLSSFIFFFFFAAWIEVTRVCTHTHTHLPAFPFSTLHSLHNPPIIHRAQSILKDVCTLHF